MGGWATLGGEIQNGLVRNFPYCNNNVALRR